MKAHLSAPRLLAAAGVLCAASIAFAQDARRYDGKSLDQWRELIQKLDFQSPGRAAAVPGLRAIINDSDVPWFTRRQAALTLGRIGAPAVPAIKDLIRLLSAPVDPVETTPPLWSLKALALFGPLAVEAAPDAIRILQNVRLPILLRLTATETLARIGVESHAGLEALIHGAAGRLDTVDSAEQLELRIACIEALQLAAPPSAVPALVAACSDPQERIRHAAAATLGFLGTRAEPAAEVLGSLVVFDGTPVVRETAARSLAKLGDQGVAVLQRLLESNDPEVLTYALDAAGRTINRRQEFIEPLSRLFDAEDPELAVRAMNAWWLATRDSRPIVNRLVQFLGSDRREARKLASDTLIQMGSAARPVRPQLEQLAAAGSNDAQAAARRVLRAIPE